VEHQSDRVAFLELLDLVQGPGVKSSRCILDFLDAERRVLLDEVGLPGWIKIGGNVTSNTAIGMKFAA